MTPLPDEPLTPPEKLSADHDLSQFTCGEPSLDNWLRRRARQNEDNGVSRTYVVCARKGRVVGYYALAAGAVAHAGAPGRVRRNAPDPVPVMALGRLAVDREFQGRGIATGMLRDAVLRTVQAAEIAGLKAILIHAISEQARRFYAGRGFIQSPVDPMALMITVTDATEALGRE